MAKLRACPVPDCGAVYNEKVNNGSRAPPLGFERMAADWLRGHLAI